MRKKEMAKLRLRGSATSNKRYAKKIYVIF